MSVSVNPPPQLRIPDKFFNDPDIRPFFEQQNTILFQMWNRTGGSDDAIASLEVGELYESGAESGYIAEIDENIEDLPQIYPETITFHGKAVSVSYTALSFEFLAVTAKATISLPENPNDQDQVIVLNVNGKEVTVDGNGKNINDDTKTTSQRKNTNIVYQYFVDLDAWYMR